MQPAQWIWYPGDYEIWLGEKMNTRRYYRGVIIPPFWRMDSNYKGIKFNKVVELSEDEDIIIESVGELAFRIDNRYQFPKNGHYTVPKGKHYLFIDVYDPSNVPAIKITGNQINTDSSWNTHCGDTNNLPVECGETAPNGIRFELQELFPETVGDHFYDFGKETFGYIKLSGLQGKGTVKLCYGESPEEAQSEEACEKLDVIEIDGLPEYTHTKSVALRYVKVLSDGVDVTGISLLYEYLPVEYRGTFHCSNEKLNQIWETARYTLHLNTREFFIDGIKRDRWVWGGDAYQSYLMNYYTFFDQDVSKRTLIYNIGKAPFTKHINTILDYTFYWFISLYDYYCYTGDISFVNKYMDRALEIIGYCLSRRDDNGYMNSRPGDWVFLDWADMDKSGVLCAEQVLFCRCLEIMSIFTRLTGKGDVEFFDSLYQEQRKKIDRDFWDDKEGYKHCDHAHKPTKYANIFSLMYDYLDGNKRKIAVENSLKNKDIMQITTPYARFYELDALCKSGEKQYVLDEILDYWGGMLDLGATTFWEEYKKDLSGTEHYAMYDRPFGKSLCHAWGASPLYLIGKYFLGVKPILAGYERYEIDLFKGDLAFIEGSVPTPYGDIEIFYDDTQIKIKPIQTKGILRFETKNPIHIASCKSIGNNRYEAELNGKELVIPL